MCGTLRELGFKIAGKMFMSLVECFKSWEVFFIEAHVGQRFRMQRRTVHYDFLVHGLRSLLNVIVALSTLVYLSLHNATLLVRAIIIILTRRREEGIV